VLAEVQGRDAGGSFTKPTIGNSPRCTHLIFSQASLRPDRFGAATLLETMPSICIAQSFAARRREATEIARRADGYSQTHVFR
jgi:hypothetical protein